MRPVRGRTSHFSLNRLYTSSDTVPAITKPAPRTISTMPNGAWLEGGEDKGGRLSDAETGSAMLMATVTERRGAVPDRRRT